MRILINNQQAVLKKGTTIDYIMENRYFTDSDDFTLTISFPLAGCPRNIAIFGHLNRKDVDNPNSVMPCTILDRHLSVKGVVAITEINETEVKVQFLAGRSVSNYSTDLDKIYIDEFSYSDIPARESFSQETNEGYLWGKIKTDENYLKWLLIPWYNSTTGVRDNIPSYDRYHDRFYLPAGSSASCMPYLLYLAKSICSYIGYSYDFSLWENSDLKYLLCCNAIPSTWEYMNYGYALPHWSVKHFFTQLEYLLHWEFNINSIDKSIILVSPQTIASQANDYLIKSPIDDFNANIENALKGEETEKPQLFKYSDSCPAIYTCDWLLKKYHYFIKPINSETEWNNYISNTDCFVRFKHDLSSELIKFNPIVTIPYYNGSYYMFEVWELDHTETLSDGVYDVYRIKLTPIASFAPFLNDKEKDSAKSIDFIPASFVENDTNFGLELTLDAGEYSSEDDMSAPNADAKRSLGRYSYAIEGGEDNERSSYYNSIYLALAYPKELKKYNGTGGFTRLYYRPFVDKVIVDPYSWQVTDLINEYPNANIFRLKQNRIYNGSTSFRDIDVKTEYHFKWIADELPNIRSMFYINGKKYVAKKITATFDDNGMSQLIKGVFYRVLK